MISVESAAGLMFGNLQCTNMRRVMDALPETEVTKLLGEWRQFITDSRETAFAKIMDSVAAHPALSASWDEKTTESQLYHAKVFQVIIDDTKLAEPPRPDNTPQTSMEQAELGGASNAHARG